MAHFSFDGEHFLAVANKRKEGLTETDSVLYRLEEGLFNEFQRISTNYNSGMLYFTINQRKLLVVSNLGWEKLSVYEWINGSFSVKVQDIPMPLVQFCSKITVTNQTYLVCGTWASSMATNIVKWTGSKFESFQNLPSCRVGHVHCFSANGSEYIAVPVFQGAGGESFVYRWDKTAFVLHQTFTVKWARAWASFVSPKGDTFLVVASKRSTVFKLTGNRFFMYQQLETTGASDIAAFSQGRNFFMVISCQRRGNTFNVNSTLYIWI